jgi:prepilin-type N-terminal cleavage/methylation domain-containing protein
MRSWRMNSGVMTSSSSLNLHDTRGFTLLELMISLGLLGLMLAMTYSVFSTATGSIPRGEAEAERAARLRAASEILSRQVRSVVNYAARTDEDVFPYFRGGADWFTFVTAAPQYRGGEGLGWVSYWVKGGQLMVGERVLFTSATVADDDPTLASEAVLLDGFTASSFQYARQEGTDVEWVNAWDGAEEQSLPAAIRLEFTGAGPRGSAWTQEIPIMVAAYALGNDAADTGSDDEIDLLNEIDDGDEAGIEE